MDEGSFTDDRMQPLNDKLSNENKKVFLAGDYNYDLMCLPTTKLSTFLER